MFNLFRIKNYRQQKNAKETSSVAVTNIPQQRIIKNSIGIIAR
jgi:hypothetical protein